MPRINQVDLEAARRDFGDFNGRAWFPRWRSHLADLERFRGAAGSEPEEIRGNSRCRGFMSVRVNMIDLDPSAGRQRTVLFQDLAGTSG